ncbi:helix-turn-helix domain-containing protein [Pseudorhodoferax soli]|uniref:AraC family transcriptional regulator n=1 Tax=Pseudorhodoferax soli TaxID=545864 RepID=A0A368XPQ0_9BURK|nr:AraC family transcriptional regulator [Pseudorhodoferax soli]RCW68487.1 AraC family transcriptional regulator [Pseudorhodoferax soli]
MDQEVMRLTGLRPLEGRRWPWSGIQVSRERLPAGECEYDLASHVGVGLACAAQGKHEFRPDGARWSRCSISPGALSFGPSHAGQARWTGNVESVSIWIETSWLMGPQGKWPFALPLSGAPIWGLKDPAAARMISEILADYEAGSPLGVAYSESLVMAVLYRINGLAMRRLPTMKSHDDLRTVSRAIDFAHANLDRRLSVGDLAAAVDFPGDLFAFSRLFKRHAGVSPQRFVLEARLDKAKHMLMGGSANVTTAAIACGFTNISHFSDAFRRRWLVSPSTVRYERGS